ncbi:DUF1064 domain-containing protein [Rhizobium leguminosarum]
MTVNLTRQEARALLTKPKRAKYGNRKVMIDGILFDSVKEGKRWQELRLLEKAGEISHLERQPKFYLYGKDGPVLIRSKGYPNGRRAAWFGDFAYFCSRRNKRICEDVKVLRTPIFILKKAVVEACYPGLEIVEI